MVLVSASQHFPVGSKSTAKYDPIYNTSHISGGEEEGEGLVTGHAPKAVAVVEL